MNPWAADTAYYAASAAVMVVEGTVWANYETEQCEYAFARWKERA